MKGDMVVALGRATVDGSTLFGHSWCGRTEQSGLVETRGQVHSPGEKVYTRFLELPQARQTYRVLASRGPDTWGYVHGINEHGVAAGYRQTQTCLHLEEPGLLSSELVRLVLERSRTALQALEVLTGLIARHGQGIFPGSSAETSHDAAFLLADAQEAFLVEAGGHYWVYQEVKEVRSVCEMCTIHQDWTASLPAWRRRPSPRGGGPRMAASSILPEPWPRTPRS